MSYLGRRRKMQQRKAKNAQKRPLRATAVWLDVSDCNDVRPTRAALPDRFQWRDDAKDRKSWLTRLRDWLGL